MNQMIQAKIFIYLDYEVLENFKYRYAFSQFVVLIFCIEFRKD